MFFFEKKNQKTFAPAPAPTVDDRPARLGIAPRQKSFGSFLQKRTAS
jgi:hypothetical protein